MLAIEGSMTDHRELDDYRRAGVVEYISIADVETARDEVNPEPIFPCPDESKEENNGSRSRRKLSGQL
ncbi:unnamed protein product [Allacma fusca]|uniref:Uncharacterized protein n=1 Tax=Allacma fusca TaxID=39272 RepID=A0A8J2KDM5_9HEXA|nr:unnamed protein product [Allacma fusca]